MNIPLIRPAKLSDLNVLIQFAEESGYGITSLPRSAAVLEKNLIASEKAFKDKISAPFNENYLFCLEWEKQVIGIAGIISCIDAAFPFFSYHIINEHHKCAHLNINQSIPVLHFTRSNKKPTEVCSLFLLNIFRHTQFGKLLSLSRFLFIANFRNRFASTVIAELRGFNRNGRSPFWDHVGRPFFHIGFPKADLLRMEHSECIQELFPKHPLYITLLPKEVQNIVRTAHPDTLPAQKLLEKQGFKLSNYVDIFDAGPHMFAPTDEIHAVSESKMTLVKAVSTHMSNATLAIIANTQLDYRATLAPLLIQDDTALCLDTVAEALQLNSGDQIRYYQLFNKP